VIIQAESTDLPPGSGAPRTRDAAATREALLRAAGQQFAVAGYHGASLGSILVGAGVTKGALYFHFTSKEALAEEVIHESVQRKCEASRTGFDSAGDPLSGLVAAISALVELWLSDPVVGGGNRLLDDPLMPTRFATENYTVGEEHVAGMLRRAADDGLLRPGVDIGLVARMILTLAAGHRLICGRTDTNDQLPARMRQVWRAVLPQVATQEWLAAHPLPAG
jgi:AcrR family transcriptional regulator